MHCSGEGYGEHRHICQRSGRGRYLGARPPRGPRQAPGPRRALPPDKPAVGGRIWHIVRCTSGPPCSRGSRSLLWPSTGPSSGSRPGSAALTCRLSGSTSKYTRGHFIGSAGILTISQIIKIVEKSMMRMKQTTEAHHVRPLAELSRRDVTLFSMILCLMFLCTNNLFFLHTESHQHVFDSIG